MRNAFPTGSLLADLAKQRDLPLCRALPVEALGVGAGRGTRGQGSKKLAGSHGEAVGGGLLHDPPGLRRGDDIGNAIDVGDDDRGAAGHAFKQDIGPSLERRDEQQEVGGAIDFRKTILWQMAEQADTGADLALAGQRLERDALRPFADNEEIGRRKADERLDHQAMALEADEIADCKKSRPRQAESPSRRVTIDRSEECQIDPIAQHVHAFLDDPERHQPAVSALPTPRPVHSPAVPTSESTAAERHTPL